MSGLSGVTALTAGDSHSCALKSDGSVACWGENADWQLGNGVVPPATPGFVVVNPVNAATPQPVTGLTGATALASGRYHNCAVKSDGSAVCCGANWSTQMGNDTYIDASTPVAIAGLTGVKALSAGEEHSCALKTDGTVACWGLNSNSQLGDTTQTDSLAPVAVTGLTSVAALTSGGYSNCATKTDGKVACWGDGWAGQLGNGALYRSAKPVATAGLSGVSKLDAGGYHACAIKADSSVVCWGDNGNGQLGNGSYEQAATPKPVFAAMVNGVGTPFTGAVSVSAGDNHSCAVKSDGSAWCWGYNDNGQLGNNTGFYQDFTTPVQVAGFDGLSEAGKAVSITAFNRRTCAIKADTTVACWGYGGYGQLGNNSYSSSNVPVAVRNLTNDGVLTGVTALSVGYYHGCALKADGTVNCWGANYWGNLGNGSYANSNIPVLVSSLTNAVALSSTQVNNCAVTATGSVVCWGYGGEGRNGNGNGGNSVTPLPVSGIATATSIGSGENNYCATLADGSSQCWGPNYDGQLGNGQIDTVSYLPVAGGFTNAQSFSGGRDFSCALKTDGTVSCAGANWNEQLGMGIAKFLALATDVVGGLVFWK